MMKRLLSEVKEEKKSFQLVRAMAVATVKRSQQEEREHGKNKCLVSFFS